MVRPEVLDAQSLDWPGVQMNPVARADGLLGIVAEHPDPARLAAFLVDFGLDHCADALPTKPILLRATDGGDWCYSIQPGASPKIVGLAFRMRDTPSARDVAAVLQSPITDSPFPGGGICISCVDPLGTRVFLVWDCKWSTIGSADQQPDNSAGRSGRINQPRPSQPARAIIRRAGHCVWRTPDLRGAVTWYARHLGLIASDVQTLPSGEPALVFLRCDRGEMASDHHTMVFSLSPSIMFGHVAFEVDDIDTLALGQQFLRSAGWQHRWGLGRHAKGSQVFDYWIAPGGIEHEHYADGDLLTADFPTRYSPFTLASLWSWGHDLPPPPPVAIPDRLQWPVGVAAELSAALGTPGRAWQTRGEPT